MTATDIRWCRTCLMPSTRPRVVFDETGQCNACSYHFNEKPYIDWDARKKEFFDVVEKHKRHPAYDCIVPFSGGKDSATVAHRLKYEFGLNPLLVTYGQLIWTDAGRRNWHRVRDAGFDIDYKGVNQQVSSQLARRFMIERGHPKNAYDAAVQAVPLRTAVEMNIPLIMWAEFGEQEYGGIILSEEHKKIRHLDEMYENLIGDDPRNWAVDGLSERDIFPYILPSQAELNKIGVTGYYFSYFHGPWDIYNNARYVRDKMGFETNWSDTEYQVHIDGDTWSGRSDGSFESFDSLDDAIDDIDYFMCHTKFLLGRSTRMASRLIQGGHMTRDDGLALVRLYDGEYPTRYLPRVLDYMDMSETEFVSIVDKHRNPELWGRDMFGQWIPKFIPS